MSDTSKFSDLADTDQGDEEEALVEALIEMEAADDSDYSEFDPEQGEPTATDVAVAVEYALAEDGIEPGDPSVGTILGVVESNASPEDVTVDAATSEAISDVEGNLEDIGVEPGDAVLEAGLDIVAEDNDSGANDALLGPAPVSGDSEDDDWSPDEEAALEAALDELGSEGDDLF